MVKTGNNMIGIECIICKEEISHPRIDQLCCERSKCRDEFNKNMIELWKIENPDQVRDMDKKGENENGI